MADGDTILLTGGPKSGKRLLGPDGRLMKRQLGAGACCDGAAPCCLPDGSCVAAPDQATCEGELHGQWHGDWASCQVPEANCPDAGACCLPAGTVIPWTGETLAQAGCRQMTGFACQALGGTYQGDGVPCEPDPCTVGACCRPDGFGGYICEQKTRSECAAVGGQWIGGPCYPQSCTPCPTCQAPDVTPSYIAAVISSPLTALDFCCNVDTGGGTGCPGGTGLRRSYFYHLEIRPGAYVLERGADPGFPGDSCRYVSASPFLSWESKFVCDYGCGGTVLQHIYGDVRAASRYGTSGRLYYVTNAAGGNPAQYVYQLDPPFSGAPATCMEPWTASYTMTRLSPPSACAPWVAAPASFAITLNLVPVP